MFQFKRNFSLQGSPSRNPPSSPSSKTLSSPAKRSRLASVLSSPQDRKSDGITQTPNSAPRHDENLSPGPAQTFKQVPLIAQVSSPTLKQVPSAATPGAACVSGSHLDRFRAEKLSLNQKKLDLELELKSLHESVKNKFKIVSQLRKEIVAIRLRRSRLDDYLDLASKSQNEIRNLLNEIYNPGNQTAVQAQSVIQERRKEHSKKFDSLSFEMNQMIEIAKETIRRKMESLKHENELHQRTILTLGYQKQAEELERREREEREKSEQRTVSEYGEDQSESTSEKASRQADDDCIIIDGPENPEYETNSDVREPARTPERVTSIEYEKNQRDTSTGASTNHYDDETTDIDEPREVEEEELSFTPCQAQRPN